LTRFGRVTRSHPIPTKRMAIRCTESRAEKRMASPGHPEASLIGGLMARPRKRMSETGIHRVYRDQIQISDVRSPPGKRISWARIGPAGSCRSRRRKFSLTVNPPSAAQSSCKHARAGAGHVGVELVVPGAVQRIRHVQPLAVEAQLQHLRPAFESAPLDRSLLAQNSTAPDLRRQLRMGGTRTSYRRMSPWSQSEK